MTEKSGAALRVEAEKSARPDALAYWYLQEATPLDAVDAPDAAPDFAATEERRMPAGWWLVPALLLSGPAWYGLFRLLF